MVNYSDIHIGTTDVFGALGDQTRLLIVMHLADSDATVNELADPFGMTLQAVSKHIRVLEKAGLVRRQKIGRSYHCKLNHDALASANHTLNKIEDAWNSRLDRLGEFLDTTASQEDD